MKMQRTGMIYKIALIGLILLMGPGNTLAHKVVVFGWVEDGVIHVQAGFGGKKKAKNSDIVIQDEKGHAVLTGKTDLQGKFSSKLPTDVFSDITIILDAGMGHLEK